jgi:TetR/AcrR family fatty acid metabolism transcriptional regulator
MKKEQVKEKSTEEQIRRVVEAMAPEIFRSGEKHERILEAALTLMDRYGFKKTTVDEIAREAKVAKGTVYLYFRDKQDIFINIISQKIAGLFLDVLEKIKDQPDTPSKILCAIRTIIEYHRNDEAINRILAQDMDFLGPLLFKEILRFEGYMVDFIAHFLRAGIKEGSIRSDIDVATTARMLLRFNRANVFRIKTGEPVDVDKYIATFRKIVLEGIGSRRKKR